MDNVVNDDFGREKDLYCKFCISKFDVYVRLSLC